MKLLSLILIFNCYGAFKDLNWGVRPSSLGGAFVAISDDTNALLYNPAGLVRLTKIESNLMYSKPYHSLEDVNLNLFYFGATYPLVLDSFGISIANMSLKGLYQEYIIGISYGGKHLKESFEIPLYFGATLKFLSHKYILDSRTQQLEEASGESPSKRGRSALGITFDLGLLYEVKEDISLGLCLKNITQPDVGIKYEDRVPIEAKLGFCWDIVKTTDSMKLATDISISKPKGISPDYNFHLGIEKYFGNFSLRGGGNFKELSLGMGLRQSAGEIPYLEKELVLEFDYSFLYSLNIKDNFGSHRISFTTRF